MHFLKFCPSLWFSVVSFKICLAELTNYLEGGMNILKIKSSVNFLAFSFISFSALHFSFYSLSRFVEYWFFDFWFSMNSQIIVFRLCLRKTEKDKRDCNLFKNAICRDFRLFKSKQKSRRKLMMTKRSRGSRSSAPELFLRASDSSLQSWAPRERPVG